MEIPGTIASVWYYEEVAQWTIQDLVCRWSASIVSIFAMATDAYWPCLIKDVVERRVVQHHIVLSLFARERIFGFDLGLLPHPSVRSVANMLFPLCVGGKHG